mgnify:CR=1 FL=1
MRNHVFSTMLLACALMLGFAGSAHAAGQGGFGVFVPVAIKAPGQAPPPAASGATWLPYWAQDGGLLSTYGASAAVDSLGGVHMVYGVLSDLQRADGLAVYAYCPASCASKAAWSFLHFGAASEVRLQLDPAGRPRVLMLVAGPTVGMGQRVRYQYASCDAGCTSPAGWQVSDLIAPIESIAGFGARQHNNNRFFALDAQGRPALVYQDFTSGHVGTYYLACTAADPAACHDTASWGEALVADTMANIPSLAFDAAGRPRIALQETNGSASTLWFEQCDQSCTSDGGWSAVQIADTSAHANFRISMRVGPQGRAQIALYSGFYNPASSPFADGRLYYLWCDSACADQAQSWSGIDLGLPDMAGEDVDMALDGQGRPRMAFTSHDQGLGLAWCDGGCESGAAWQSRLADPSGALADDFDVLPARRCTVSTWFTGVRPSLALDAQGHPRIGYDAQHYWYGSEIDGQHRPCNIKDVNVTRVALVSQP